MSGITVLIPFVGEWIKVELALDKDYWPDTNRFPCPTSQYAAGENACDFWLHGWQTKQGNPRNVGLVHALRSSSFVVFNLTHVSFSRFCMTTMTKFQAAAQRASCAITPQAQPCAKQTWTTVPLPWSQLAGMALCP